jgi:hypothetical protein
MEFHLPMLYIFLSTKDIIIVDKSSKYIIVLTVLSLFSRLLETMEAK